ncbi:hypothetical protein D3C77_606840 [compost metagenome]
MNGVAGVSAARFYFSDRYDSRFGISQSQQSRRLDVYLVSLSRRWLHIVLFRRPGI